MTKRKTGVFRGAWMDPTVPERLLEALINNEPGNIDSAPIIREVARQRSIWRFDKLRRDTEPEPAQWAKLVMAIGLPASPEPFAILELRRQVGSLPLRVLAELDAYIYRQRRIGWRALIGQILEYEVLSDLELFNMAMRELGRASIGVRGKRGPQWDPGPALRSVTQAILESSNLSQASARSLAASLLAECGIRVPREKSQLIEKTKK